MPQNQNSVRAATATTSSVAPLVREAVDGRWAQVVPVAVVGEQVSLEAEGCDVSQAELLERPELQR